MHYHFGDEDGLEEDGLDYGDEGLLGDEGLDKEDDSTVFMMQKMNHEDGNGFYDAN